MIRRLDPGDAPLYRAIRREAIETHPDRFAQTVAELDVLPDAAIAARLQTVPTFVAFEDTSPVGLMAYKRLDGAVFRHRANLLNVFVSPRARGRGHARRLLDRCLAEARSEGVTQMELVVTVENTSAIGFYERAGFDTVGTVPDAFRVGERLVDEHIMVKPLTA